MRRHHRPPSRTRCTALACAALAASAIAQVHVALPLGTPTADANSSRALEGFGVQGRTQILVPASMLSGLVGLELTGVSFRADVGRTTGHAGGRAHVRIRLGACATDLAAPSSDFAANLRDATLVLDGIVAVPPSRSEPVVVGWDDPDVLRCAFEPPWRYRGGDLVIDIDGEPLDTDWLDWVPDAVGDATAGSVARIGHGCGPLAMDGHTASVPPRDLIAGQAATASLFATPGATAWLGVGATPLATPLDLTALGAAGCELGIEPIAFTAAVAAASGLDPALGIARVSFPIPSHPAFAGASFALQWFELGPTPRTSEVLVCTTAPTAPALGMTLVSQQQDRAVEISRTRVPVLRLSARE